MAELDFRRFQKQLLIALADHDENNGPSYVDLENLAQSFNLRYRRGWIRKAATNYNDNDLIKCSFDLGGGDDGGIQAEITADGLSQVEEWREEGIGSDPVPVQEDRTITIDRSRPEYADLAGKLTQLTEAVRGNNEYAATDPDDHEQRVAELEGGQRLLEATRVRVRPVWELLVKGLRYLATKFAENAIGVLATAALSFLAALFGFHLG